MKKVLITGINGQDGSYLAEFLLGMGYEVHGTVRRSSIENNNKLVNIKHIIDKIKIHPLSLDDQLSIYKLISQIKPDECYHLAASSFVSYEFTDELSTMSTNFNSTHYFLATIKELVPECRFYFAGSSEMFGNVDVSPQNEDTKFNPRSIYGISKLSSYYVVKNYRENQNIHASTGITYNHESPRRDYSFVTRKISSSVAKIYCGLAHKIELGNINAYRDWGYAPEYVQAMWKMLNASKADDYIISTGTSNSVETFLDIAFSVVNLDYKKYIEINENFFRPSEKIRLIGDNSKIQKKLQWKPEKQLEKIIEEMVLNDISILKGDKK